MVRAEAQEPAGSQGNGHSAGVSTTVFVAELTYAGVFTLSGLPDNAVEPVLLVECPRILFPFARNILADVTRDGGFPRPAAADRFRGSLAGAAAAISGRGAAGFGRLTKGGIGTFALPPFACRDCVTPRTAVWIIARDDDARVVVCPVLVRESTHIGGQSHRLQNLVRIHASWQWLHLHQRPIGTQADRHVRSRQTDVGEQRSKTAVAFQNSFVNRIPAGRGKVGRGADQQAPARSRPNHQPGPDLHHTRVSEGREERWRAAA